MDLFLPLAPSLLPNSFLLPIAHSLSPKFSLAPCLIFSYRLSPHNPLVAVGQNMFYLIRENPSYPRNPCSIFFPFSFILIPSYRPSPLACSHSHFNVLTGFNVAARIERIPTAINVTVITIIVAMRNGMKPIDVL